MRILIADDDKSARIILKKELEHVGHSVEAATNGKEALEMAKASLPDMIISDILMPVMDGFKLLREVKKDELLKKTPFVFYTATFIDPEDKRLADSLGVSCYIIKPMEPDKFLKTISAILNKAQEKSLVVPEPSEGDEKLSEMYADTISRKLQEKVKDLKLLRKIFNNMNEAVIIIDPKGFYIEQNPTHVALFGYSDEDLIGKTPGLLFGVKVFSRMIKELSEKGIYHDEVIAYTKRGQKLNIDLISFPLLDENGNTLCFIGIKHDITEKRAAQEAKKRLWNQLLQAQKLESVGRMTGGIAHDFNNLLTVILGCCGLAVFDLPADHQALKRFKTIEECCLDAGKLIKQLLAFSRNQELHTELTNLSLIIENMKKMFVRLINKDITLELNLDQNISAVNVDGTQIGQVLMNLVVNAGDAMQKGGDLRIETKDATLDKKFIESHPCAKTGDYVRLSITDTGTGMSDDIKDKVFDPFFTTKEKEKGTGLGLSTAFGIVKQHGGFITIDSEIGKGTTVNIFLPALKDKATITQREPALEIRRGDETILVVDDDTVICNFIVTTFKQYGYNVFSAKSGEDALKVSDSIKGAVDLLITDFNMTEMNGWELYEELKKRVPAVKVIFISAYVDDEFVSKMEKHGFIVRKPFASKLLAGKIREILDDKKEVIQ